MRIFFIIHVLGPGSGKFLIQFATDLQYEVIKCTLSHTRLHPGSGSLPGPD